MTKPSTNAMQRSLREVIADDSHALTFQTAGQYRAALLKHEPMEHTHHAEAFAWAVFAKDDNVIIWSKNRAQVESASKEYGRPIVPVIALFASEQGAAPVPPTHCDPAEGFYAKCREQERSALDAQQPAPPGALLAVLRDVHDTLSSESDSDIDHFEDDEKEREGAPVQYAARKVMEVMDMLKATATSSPGTQEAPKGGA